MHSRTYPRRLAGITAALVLLTGLLTATAIAKPPNYGQEKSATPDYVTYGGQVRFDVGWTNTSGANLPTVFASAATPAGAELVAVLATSQGSCAATIAGDLSCDFGTVNAGVKVDIAVVYQVPAAPPPSTFSVTFIFTAQGATGSDKPGQSRGDDMPITASVPLTGDPDEGGTYVYGEVTTLENNQILHKQRNPQSASLDFAGNDDPDGFGATIDELGGTAFPCPGQTTCYGFWNVLSVNEGAGTTGSFETVLGYSTVPANAVGGFVHWLTSNTATPVEGTDYELIDEACTFDTSGDVENLPCIASVAKIQGNTFFTILSEDNGPMRGY